MNMLMSSKRISPEFWKGYWKHSIGFDRMVNTMLNGIESDAFFESNYPPHDIVKTSDVNWKIILAVAGFKEEEITVEQKENILTITGDSLTDGEYVFRKVFPLVEAAEVTQAALKNGLLEININVAIPEEQKPKLIPINNS